MPTTAAEVMTTNPRTCSTFSSILEAVMIFRDADCGAVPVLEDGKAVGLLTDRDVALALTEHMDNLSHLPVADVMTRGVVAVAPTDTLDTVAEKFADKAVRRLLVMDPTGELVGIIAWADIAGHVSDRQVGQMVTNVVES